MKNILILVFTLAFASANEPTLADIFGKAQLKNGDQSASPSATSKLTQVSLWLDINVTNIKKFGIVPTEKTSVTSGNPYEKILLSTVTFGTGIHPSYAEIQASNKKLIFVFDINDTSKGTKDLVIGAGVLRDGDRGGALNADITVPTLRIDDKAGPVVVSYKTVDSATANGYIDKIELTFSENITKYGDVNSTFIIGSSYKNKTAASVVTSKILRIPLEEKTAHDTHIAPDISYNHTNKKDHNITDAAENLAPTFSLTSSSVIVKTKDTAKPILVSYGVKSNNAANDVIYLGFSEPIRKNLKEGRVTISAAVTNKLDNAVIAYPTSVNATITLNETIDGEFYKANMKIKIEDNASDFNDNNFTAVTSAAMTTTLELIKPKISSLVRFEDEDKLKLTFNEPMSDSVGTASRYTISGEHNTSVLTVDVAAQSADKKSVLLTIGNFPAFSSNTAAVRKITIVAGDDIKDFAGNAMSSTAADRTATMTILRDAVHPKATSFTLNMKTGKLDIIFDEKVVVGDFAPATIDINTSYTLSGKNLLTGSSKAVYSDKTVNISLNEDLDRVKNFIKDKEDINLTIRSGSGIIDFNARAYNGGNVSNSGFVPDDEAPKFISWEYDLDAKKFKLLFNEAMKVGTYVPAKIKISDKNSSGDDLVMRAGSSSAKVIDSPPYRTVEINLLASQVNDILAKAKVGEDINQTFMLILANSGITDSKGKDIGDSVHKPRAKTWKASRNAVATLKVIANKWNHISVDNNTTSNDILSTGKVSYIYGHDATGFIKFPTTLYPHKGYWIKTSNASGTSFPVAANKNVKGSKEDDLARIKSKTDGKFHLIGLENNITYEEIQATTPSSCKSMRVHHYVSATDKTKEGWDVNKSLSANDALWVLCIK